MPVFEKTTRLPHTAETVFQWHARGGALQRLTPPWESVELISQTGGIEDGARVEMRVKTGPLWRTWVALHSDCQPPNQFRDVQTQGPFAAWDHTHHITRTNADNSCELTDHISYRFPFGAIGRLLGGRFTRRKLDGMFAYRHRTTRDDLRLHQICKFKKDEPMRILVTGSTGLVGSNLIPLLTTGGHAVCRLVRSTVKNPSEEIRWDPAASEIDTASLDGFDAIVHLAGENIAGARWSDKQQARIRDSRVDGTRFLAESLANCASPPKVLVCASAIGFYGDRGDEPLDEHSAVGTGFLAEVCRDWEAAADPAGERGIRVANLRFGVILTPQGGALQKMLLPFKLCAGGVVGSGRQYWSWIGIDDVIGAILHAVSDDSMQGPVNVTSPNPATNREFTKTLGRVLRRPTIVPMPAFAARLALGKMADDLLLASARVLPKSLLASDYEFRHTDLEACLRHVLGR